MSSILLVRPANDAVAIELSAWAAGVKKLAASSSGTSVGVDLASGAATRAAVDLELPNHEATFFCGHGTPTKLRGAGIDLVDAANVGLAAKRGILAIACSSADTLGPAAIQNNVKAYLGFTKKLTWVTGDPDGQFEPAICAGARQLINGGDMRSAHQEMQVELDKVVAYYHSGAGRTSPNAGLGFVSAFWDFSHLAMHGNGSYTL